MYSSIADEKKQTEKRRGDRGYFKKDEKHSDANNSNLLCNMDRGALVKKLELLRNINNIISEKHEKFLLYIYDIIQETELPENECIEYEYNTYEEIFIESKRYKKINTHKRSNWVYYCRFDYIYVSNMDTCVHICTDDTCNEQKKNTAICKISHRNYNTHSSRSLAYDPTGASTDALVFGKNKILSYHQLKRIRMYGLGGLTCKMNKTKAKKTTPKGKGKRKRVANNETLQNGVVKKKKKKKNKNKTELAVHVLSSSIGSSSSTPLPTQLGKLEAVKKKQKQSKHHHHHHHHRHHHHHHHHKNGCSALLKRITPHNLMQYYMLKATETFINTVSVNRMLEIYKMKFKLEMRGLLASNLKAETNINKRKLLFNAISDVYYRILNVSKKTTEMLKPIFESMDVVQEYIKQTVLYIQRKCVWLWQELKLGEYQNKIPYLNYQSFVFTILYTMKYGVEDMDGVLIRQNGDNIIIIQLLPDIRERDGFDKMYSLLFPPHTQMKISKNQKTNTHNNNTIIGFTYKTYNTLKKFVQDTIVKYLKLKADIKDIFIS